MVLPAATGGAGTLAYRVSPTMGSGLRFAPSTRTVEGTLTGAAETVVYTYTVTDGNGNTAQLTFTVAVFDIKVTVRNEGLEEGRWKIWDYAQATVSDSILRLGNYQFKVVIPASAGFQVDSTDCTWPVAPPTAIWALSSPWVSQGGRFDLVRCGLGSGRPSRIEVWFKLGDHGTPSLLHARDVIIPQSWHEHDERVDYYVMGAGSNPNATHVTGVQMGTAEGMFPSARPSHLAGRSPTYHLLLLAHYDNAAGAWNDEQVGVTIRRVHSDASADVLIEGYWEPGKKNDKCGGSVACVEVKGTYPHIGKANRMWIEDYPRWAGDYEADPPIQPRQWTVHFDVYDNNRDLYVYLPGILKHEFGHSIGLGHGGSDSIMTGHYDLQGLSADDIEGAKAIYQHHDTP